jgi:hypothetical protein
MSTMLLTLVTLYGLADKYPGRFHHLGHHRCESYQQRNECRSHHQELKSDTMNAY